MSRNGGNRNSGAVILLATVTTAAVGWNNLALDLAFINQNSSSIEHIFKDTRDFFNSIFPHHDTTSDSPDNGTNTTSDSPDNGTNTTSASNPDGNSPSRTPPDPSRTPPDPSPIPYPSSITSNKEKKIFAKSFEETKGYLESQAAIDYLGSQTWDSLTKEARLIGYKKASEVADEQNQEKDERLTDVAVQAIAFTASTIAIAAYVARESTQHENNSRVVI